VTSFPELQDLISHGNLGSIQNMQKSSYTA
jgi:hypothetical protein